MSTWSAVYKCGCGSAKGEVGLEEKKVNRRMSWLLTLRETEEGQTTKVFRRVSGVCSMSER